jgi:hypothetical protein
MVTPKVIEITRAGSTRIRSAPLSAASSAAATAPR